MGRLGGMGGGRGDIDNSAPTPLLHLRQAGAYHSERTTEIDIDRIQPFLVRMSFHALMNRNAGGIYQFDHEALDNPGDTELRGFVRTRGDFTINNNWTWGWDATAISDDTVLRRSFTGFIH